MGFKGRWIKHECQPCYNLNMCALGLDVHSFPLQSPSLVRMAERSKVPDLRTATFLATKEFWSPHGGVGSSPTPDNYFFHPNSFIADNLASCVAKMKLLVMMNEHETSLFGHRDDEVHIVALTVDYL